MARLTKGQHITLNVTQEARHRIFVGLGWDPNFRQTLLGSIREMLGGKKTWHDLNLACFLYDDNKNYIESISQDPDNAADEAIHVYHSGDSREGVGDGDDEQISVELKNLAPSVRHVIFVASIKSGHTFKDIEAPEIRIGDGYSNHIFFETDIDREAGKNKSVFVFVHIYRHEGGWRLHNISEFLKAPDTENNPDFMKKYLIVG